MLTNYNDPGHAWLRVNRSIAKRLMGELFYKISPFSYQFNDYIYLEEDCDAGLLIQALKNQGIQYTIKENFCNNQSRIRSYSSFQA
jgi:hypothetical protein